MWLHLSLVSLSLVMAATPAEQAAELVRKLGSARFEDRKAAEEGLRRPGPRALPAVRAGLKSDDTGVRPRCQRMLPPLEAAYWRQEADTFEADRDGKRWHDLPLWGEYRKLVGADPAARRLFA